MRSREARGGELGFSYVACRAAGAGRGRDRGLEGKTALGVLDMVK
jgi:hypothetical protein